MVYVSLLVPKMAIDLFRPIRTFPLKKNVRPLAEDERLTMLRALGLKYDKVLVLQSQPEMMEQPILIMGMGPGDNIYDTVTWGDMMSIES